MKLFSIETGNLKLDGGAMFGVVPKVVWQKLYPADENNLCNWSMRSILFDDGAHRILVDTGIGDKQDEKFFTNFHLNGDATLLSSLAKYGYHAHDITDIVLTHLHFDHCGGCAKNAEDKKPELVFKNARYWVGKTQWELAIKPNKREKASYLPENFMPIKDSGRLNLIEKDMELYPGFCVHIYNGHTDGQVIPFITYHDRTIVFMADLIAAVAHLPIPWVMGYDTRPLLVMEEKEKFLAEAVANDYVLFFEHDLYNECCTLQTTEKGVRAKDRFKLTQLTNS